MPGAVQDHPSACALIDVVATNAKQQKSFLVILPLTVGALSAPTVAETSEG
jgi:hypothetical protein